MYKLGRLQSALDRHLREQQLSSDQRATTSKNVDTKLTVSPTSIWDTFSKKVTIAGLEELISEREGPIRLLFLIGLILAAILTIYSCYGAAQQFLDETNPLNIEFHDRDEILFPNITKCTTAIINITKAKEFLFIPENVEKELKKQLIDHEYILQFLDTTFLHPNPNHLHLLEKAVYATTKKLFSNDNIYDLIRASMQSCDQTLFDCDFNGHPIDCCYKNIFGALDGFLCYGIPTAQKISVQSTKSFEFNVKVRMDWRHIPFIRDNDTFDGFLVIAGQPFSMTANSPIAVSPGWHATLKLSQIKYRQDSTDCVSRSNLPKLDYFDYYDEDGKNCQTNVFLKAQNKYVQCVTYIGNYFPNVSVACGLRQEVSAMAGLDGEQDGIVMENAKRMSPKMVALMNKTFASLMLLRQSVSKSCPPICDRWLYEPIVGYSELRNSFGSANDIDKNISWSKITVYLPTSYYEVHKEGQKSTIYFLLCNIGGIFGVYAGLSMITFIQVIAYGLYTCCLMKKKRRENKITRQHPIINRRRLNRVAPAPLTSITQNMSSQL